MSLQSIRIPAVSCQQKNHHCRNFEFVCLERQCLKYNNNLLCFYCIKEDHPHQILSLKQFVQECLKLVQNRAQHFQNLTNVQHQQFYQLQHILLKGLQNCKTKEQLNGIIEQIYKAIYVIGDNQKLKTMQNILNHQMAQIKAKNQSFYLTQRRQFQHNSFQRKQNTKLTTKTQFQIPILSFNVSSNFTSVSPFQIRHEKSGCISSDIAYPSLSTFSQSVQIFVKILKLTPNWMGIGISIGQNSYQQNSKSHITLLANGWVNQNGVLKKQNRMKFLTGHIISLRWDKQLQLLNFKNTNTHQQYSLKFAPQWNQEVFICLTMFFKNDSTVILQSN